jgi:hypothetical protein
LPKRERKGLGVLATHLKRRIAMLVSSDFLRYLKMKKREAEKKSGPLISAALKSSPGGKEQAPPVDQSLETRVREKSKDGEVEFLNERRSTLNVVL